jgi:hypothetical protein
MTSRREFLKSIGVTFIAATLPLDVIRLIEDGLRADPMTPQGKPRIAIWPNVVFGVTRNRPFPDGAYPIHGSIWRISTLYADDEYGLEMFLSERVKKLAEDPLRLIEFTKGRLMYELERSMVRRYGAPARDVSAISPYPVPVRLS